MDALDYFLVLYDIADDKRRTRLFKLLEGYGASYQYSVFEARLDARRLVRLRHDITEIIDRDVDRVALIKLCEACRKKADLLGTQGSTICQHVLIV